MSMLFFSSFSRLVSLKNITINSKVWNKVVSWRISWFFKRSREFGLQFTLSLFNVMLSIYNIFIDTKIWYCKTWWLPWFFKRMMEFVIIFFFSILNAFLSFNNIFIFSEIWNFVINWMTWWFLKCSLQLMTELFLSKFKVLNCMSHFSILTIWLNWIINIPVWFFPGWNRSIMMPWICSR